MINLKGGNMRTDTKGNVVCKHGIRLEWCSVCNGDNAKVDKAVKDAKVAKVAKAKYNADRKELQSLSMAFATRHKEKFTDEELHTIVGNTYGVEKEDLGILFPLAEETKRRLGAMEWIWNMAWDVDFTDYDKNEGASKLYKRVQDIRVELGV